MSAAKHTPIPVRLPRSGAEPGRLSEQELADIRAAAAERKQRILEGAGYFEMAEALRQSTQALENIAAYLVKHQDKLPPVSLTGTELQIERNRAALAKAGL